MFGKRILFFCAHTDDEMICAGTLYRLAQSGCEVHMLVATGAALESDRIGSSLSETVFREWQTSMDLIGIRRSNGYLINLYPSADLRPHAQTICQKFYDTVERIKPDTVISLSPEDENPSHSVIGIECERVTRGRVPTTIRCQFPWNHSVGRPNLYVKLTDDELKVKCAVADAYESQKFRYDYGKIMLHQAYADGLSVKAHAAEKFEIVRSVL